MAISVIYQTQVPRELLGRVQSVGRMLSLPAVALCELLSGVMNDYLPVWVSVAVGAAGVILVPVLFRTASGRAAHQDAEQT